MNSPTRSTVFQDIASAIGRESAHKLVDAFGGIKIFVPAKVTPDHRLARAIGLEAARQLSSFYHGTELDLPVNASRRREVLALAEKGIGASEIALKTQYSRRQVYRILGEEDDGRQGNLFSGDDEDR